MSGCLPDNGEVFPGHRGCPGSHECTLDAKIVVFCCCRCIVQVVECLHAPQVSPSRGVEQHLVLVRLGPPVHEELLLGDAVICSFLKQYHHGGIRIAVCVDSLHCSLNVRGLEAQVVELIRGVPAAVNGIGRGALEDRCEQLVLLSLGEGSAGHVWAAVVRVRKGV